MPKHSNVASVMTFVHTFGSAFVITYCHRKIYRLLGRSDLKIPPEVQQESREIARLCIVLTIIYYALFFPVVAYGFVQVYILGVNPSDWVSGINEFTLLAETVEMFAHGWPCI